MQSNAGNVKQLQINRPDSLFSRMDHQHGMHGVIKGIYGVLTNGFVITRGLDDPSNTGRRPGLTGGQLSDHWNQSVEAEHTPNRREIRFVVFDTAFDMNFSSSYRQMAEDKNREGDLPITQNAELAFLKFVRYDSMDKFEANHASVEPNKTLTAAGCIASILSDISVHQFYYDFFLECGMEMDKLGLVPFSVNYNTKLPCVRMRYRNRDASNPEVFTEGYMDNIMFQIEFDVNNLVKQKRAILSGSHFSFGPRE